MNDGSLDLGTCECTCINHPNSPFQGDECQSCKSFLYTDAFAWRNTYQINIFFFIFKMIYIFFIL